MITFIRGDFRFFWPENINNFSHLPSAWDSVLNTGLGISSIASLWITSYLNFTALFSNTGLSWNAISIIFWFIPIVVLSFLSAFLLFTYLFPGKKYFGFFAGFFYIFNTYFLLIFGGGQMGVALAYSLAPLTLLTFFRLFNNPQLKNSILFAFIFSLQLLFDPRIVYITVVAIGIYWLFHFSLQNLRKQVAYIVIIPGLLTLFLHSYWILPLILTHGSSIPKGLLSAPSLSFFSFADFSHSLSLLHPNWPENIFGKVYFLQPEFLLLPILAYASLFFVGKSQETTQNLAERKTIALFALLGLLGAFLAKGVNPPFGQLYSWLFIHILGFKLFRDPTKWYLLIIISYVVLIPFTIDNLYVFIQKKILIKNKFLHTHVSKIFLPVVVLYFLFLVRPVFSPTSTLFRSKVIPHDYVLLKDFLVKDKQFSRTLWVPSWQRYGYFSEIHPAIGRDEFFPSPSDSIAIVFLNKAQTKQLLKEAAVKYIIVPYDSEGEIFINNHKYDNKQVIQTVKALQKIPWLSQVNGFDKLAIFKLANPQNHFYLFSGGNVSYQFINETQYTVSLHNIKAGDRLIFSEGYDPQWVASLEGISIPAQSYHKYFNSFALPKSGNYQLIIYYNPQMWVNTGLVISSLTALFIMGLLFFYKPS